MQLVNTLLSVRTGTQMSEVFVTIDRGVASLRKLDDLQRLGEFRLARWSKVELDASEPLI